VVNTKLNSIVELIFVDGLLTVADVVERHKGLLSGTSLAASSVLKDVGNETLKGASVSCLKSGMFGASLDGLLGIRDAKRYYDTKVIDKPSAVRHIIKEAGCGFTSSTIGTAASKVATVVFKTSPSASLIVGLGASVGARYAYRSTISSELPKPVDVSNENLNGGDLEESPPNIRSLIKTLQEREKKDTDV
jgi:hypothetical protein